MHKAAQQTQSKKPRRPHRARRRLESTTTKVREFWLYGRHTVTAALKNPVRVLRRLIATSEEAARLKNENLIANNDIIEVVPRMRLDEIIGVTSVHQGIALQTSALPQPSLDQLLVKVAHKRPHLFIVLDQVTDPQNVGAVIRSSAAFGVQAVIAQARRAPDESGSMAKAASGAMEIVPYVKVTNLARTLEQFKSNKIWTVGLDNKATSEFSCSNLADSIALVVGSEGHGLRRLVAANCDELAKLPIVAAIDSLNVSTAAAVALYEVSRQRSSSNE